MKIVKSKISIFIIIVAIVLCFILGNIIKNTNDGPISVKYASKLESIYNYEDYMSDFQKVVYLIFSFPWISTSPIDIFENVVDDDIFYIGGEIGSLDSIYNGSGGAISSSGFGSLGNGVTSSSSSAPSSNNFSTTNIQVENVDEADVIKTDGNYIYSLSDNKVIITDVSDEENPVIIKELPSQSFVASSPEELLLYKDKLIVIGTMNGDTTVEVLDITSRENPQKIESYSINGKYYTSRLTNGNLYVFSTGSLRFSKDNAYTENSVSHEIDYNDVYYFKNKYTTAKTVITTLDLDETDLKVKTSIYLLSLDNLYVSEDSMYLVTGDNYYEPKYNFLKIAVKLLGPRGIIGEVMKMSDEDYEEDYTTTIYKFNLNDGNIKYVGNGKGTGYTIDQFSLDEYNSNLRVAYYTGEGSKVAVYNDKMKLIGETGLVARGEKMYSSRFIGDRGYLVTYLNTDPLFCIDLSNPKSPEILGELQIDGYSVYLHPYDENHLIGIGYDSEVVTNRNSSGKVTSTYAVITGMKMALFDVSNIKNPILLSSTKIGDKYTSSAILTNHKALLFSKEKGIIAIPVNTYTKGLELSYIDNDFSSIASSYKNNTKSYKYEGYLVYDINLDDGFSQKGFILHDSVEEKYSGTNLIRGVYIKDYLYTVSQSMIKVNDLNTLEELNSILVWEEK